MCEGVREGRREGRNVNIKILILSSQGAASPQEVF